MQSTHILTVHIYTISIELLITSCYNKQIEYLNYLDHYVITRRRVW